VVFLPFSNVVEAFKSAPHFEIIATNLTHEQEQKLREVFA
jgi:hypothetical protein